MTNFEQLLQALVTGGVRFVVVGGIAGTSHGSVRLTQDLDIVYARDSDNLRRLVTALAPLHPYPRGAPPGLPFLWDAETLRKGLNFTLVTDFGWLDLLGEIAGGGDYSALVGQSISVSLFGFECQCLDLKPLIKAKRAAGRPKDFDGIAELEALLEERDSQG